MFYVDVLYFNFPIMIYNSLLLNASVIRHVSDQRVPEYASL